MNINKNNICAITVTYKPYLKSFKDVIDRIFQNFNNVVIINNSPELKFDFMKKSNVHIICNKENIGLSVALNIGIDYAKKKGYKYISLFDQDTLIGFDYLDQMIFFSKKLQIKENCVLSPIYKNLLNNLYSKKINVKKLLIQRNQFNLYKISEEADYVITSGSIIPISIIDDVGNMNEKLFIDFIDIEWCLRARMKGYKIYVFNQILILQSLGNFTKNIFGKNYNLYSPLRTYYFFRNAIYLYLYSDLPVTWRICDFFRSIFRILFYIFFANKRLIYLCFIFSGLCDGIKGKMYKKQD